MAGGHSYRVFFAEEKRVELSLSRPDQADRSVSLSVPGTYSSPKGIVEGFVVLNGEIVQDKERQGWNGAVIFQPSGSATIIPTDNGKFLTKEYLTATAMRGDSLIQAHLLVDDGRAQSFKEQPLYQRRALVTFLNGKTAVIESVEWLDLNTFVADLVELSVRQAVNLDMGQWSEGWYRDQSNDQVMVIGDLRTETAKQTNWIIFRSGAFKPSGD